MENFMKYFDQVSDEDDAQVEVSFGKALINTFDETSDLPVGKEIRQAAVGETKAQSEYCRGEYRDSIVQRTGQ